MFQSQSFNLLRGDGSSTVKGENKISRRFLSWRHGKSSSSSDLKLVALASTSSVSGSGAEYSGNPTAVFSGVNLCNSVFFGFLFFVETIKMI